MFNRLIKRTDKNLDGTKEVSPLIAREYTVYFQDMISMEVRPLGLRAGNFYATEYTVTTRSVRDILLMAVGELNRKKELDEMFDSSKDVYRNMPKEKKAEFKYLERIFRECVHKEEFDLYWFGKHINPANMTLGDKWMQAQNSGWSIHYCTKSSSVGEIKDSDILGMWFQMTKTVNTRSTEEEKLLYAINNVAISFGRRLNNLADTRLFTGNNILKKQVIREIENNTALSSLL